MTVTSITDAGDVAVVYVVPAAFAAPCDRCPQQIGAGDPMARLTDHSYVHLDCAPEGLIA